MQNKLEELLQQGPVAINIGVQDFAATLQEQGVQVVHVDWTPPAADDQEMLDLLDQLL